MKDHIFKAIDARQTSEWGTYIKSIGWQVKTFGKTQLFFRKIPKFNYSIAKIQHAFNPVPFLEIDSFARDHNTLFVLVEPHNVGFDEKQFIKHGYIPSKMFNSHTATLKIDLRMSEDELLKSFSENARRNIKRAQKNSITTKAIYFNKEKNAKKYFEEFYTLVQNVGRMKKFYVPSREEFLKKMKAFTSILLFAYEKNEPIGVVWFAKYQNILGYFQTGITKKGYETLANYLLVWEGLKVGKKLNCEIFDFESIYDPRFPKENKGYKKYTEFKKRFHGELIEYPRPWIKIYNPVFKGLYFIASKMI